MADETTRLFLDIIGRDKGASRTLGGVGDSADKSSRQVDQLTTSIGETRDSITLLAKEIKSTGDLTLFPQLQREQARLRKMLKVQDLLDGERGGRDQGDRFARGFARAFGAGTVGLVGQLGSGLAKAVPGALGSAMQTLPPQAQAAIGAGVVAAVATAAPALGATVSGAILAGLGGGTIAGGLALAARDSRVSAAGAALGAELLAGLEDAAGSFVTPALRSIGILRDAWRDIQPDIRAAFESVSPFVDDLARGLGDAARNVMPGFLSAVRESGPILSMIGQEIGDLGAAFGQFFRDISGGSGGAMQALRLLFDFAEKNIAVTGKTIGFLSAAFEKINVLGKFMAGDLAGAAGAAVGGMDELRGSADQATSGFERLSEAQRLEAQAMGASSVAATRQQERLDMMNLSMGAAIEKAGSLTAALDVLSGDTMDLTAAERGYQAAIDAKAVKMRSYTEVLSQNTEAGRTNRASLDQIQTSTMHVADATLRTTGSQEQATAAIERGRAAYIRQAVAMGVPIAKARELAQAIFGIPGQRQVTVRAETAAAMANLRALRNDLDKIRNKTVRLQINAVLNIADKALSTFFPWMQRDGGVVKAASGHLGAGIVNRQTVLFGERETGGEAFIPRRPGRGGVNRQRAIVAQAASWAGLEVVPAGAGRVGAPAPVPVDYDRLARAVGRELDRALARMPILRLTNAGYQADIYTRGG